MVIRGFEYLLEVMILVTRHRAAIPIHAAYAAYPGRGGLRVYFEAQAGPPVARAEHVGVRYGEGGVTEVSW